MAPRGGGATGSVVRSETGPAEKEPLAEFAAVAQPSENHKLPNVGDAFNPYGMFNGIWVPESLLKYPRLSASAKLLYGRLARFAGENGLCFPSIETLAAELGMTGRQIQRLIGQLCSAGFLRKNSQYRPNGSQKANAYVFLYHASLAPAPLILPRDAEPPHSENGRPASWGDKNVTGDKDAALGVTTTPPLEDSQLNSRSVSSSSNSKEPTVTTQAAADPDPDRYPLSAARFREFFPRTTNSVVARILRAVLSACPGCADEDIAASVRLERDQTSPGLWTQTMPEQVRMAFQRRVAGREYAQDERQWMADAIGSYGRRCTMRQRTGEDPPSAIVLCCLEAADRTPPGEVGPILR